MIGQFLSINADRHPDRIAVVFGTKRYTYKQLNERACRLANALSDLDIRAGDRVATLVNNCHHFIELVFATAKIGALLVPINFRLSAKEVEFALRNCTPKALFLGRSLQAILDELAATDAVPQFVQLVPDRTDLADIDNVYETWLAPHAAHEVARSVTLNEAHLLVHSSGTTGYPKAAIWTHGTTLNSCLAKITDFAITAEDSTAVFGPLFHVGPLMDIAVPLLLRGGKLVIGESSAFDPVKVLRTAEEEAVTLLTIYPTMWRRVIQEVDVSKFELSKLRMLLTGGEPIPVSLLREIYAKFPRADFVNTYGSTEGGPITTFLAPSHNVQKIGSIGRPAFGVEVKIVNPGDGCVRRGEVGELLVRSPFICAGYWNQPEATAASSLDGWWRTGDLASMDQDGFLWIEGRKKDLIISGAENIYPAEIERVIATLADVREVSVVGVPDEIWGEAVAAYVVLKSGSSIDATQVIDHCKAELASYKKPKHVRFVDALPRTTLNKISKVQLRQQF